MGKFDLQEFFAMVIFVALDSYALSWVLPGAIDHALGILPGEAARFAAGR